MKTLNILRRGLGAAAAAMLALAAGSARLSAQCFNDDYPGRDHPCNRPSPTDKPAIVMEGVRLHVFVKGTDNALWHRVRMGLGDTAPWGPWGSLGGTLASGPAASVRPGTSTVDVFIRSTSNQLLHRASTGANTWTAWENVGGSIDSDPASVSWDANRIDVFARNLADKTLGHAWWPSATGGWSPWQSLGGTLAGGPAVASWAPNRLDVFVAGGGSYMYHKSWNGAAWSEYDAEGCCIVGTPAAFSGRTNSLYIAALGTDGRIFAQTYDESGWSGWKWALSEWPTSASPALAIHLQPSATELVAISPGFGTLMRLAAENGADWGQWEPLTAGPYLTNITTTANRDYATAMAGCPPSYTPLGQDLNEGAGGDYIFLCLQWGQNGTYLPPIYDIGIYTDGAGGDNIDCPGTRNSAWTRAGADLNQGAGGKTLYLCTKTTRTGAQLPVKNIVFRTTTLLATVATAFSADPLTCTTGERLNTGSSTQYWGNLNQGTPSGKYIIACMVRAR